MAQSLRSITPQAISYNQNSFVHGHCASDNVLALQGVVYTMSNMTGKTRYMMLKLNLEKGYDRLEWSFVISTLELLLIPAQIIAIIQACISSAAMQINWNGQPMEAFQSHRG